MSVPRLPRGSGEIAHKRQRLLHLTLNDSNQCGGRAVVPGQHRVQMRCAHGNERKGLAEIVHRVPEKKFGGPVVSLHKGFRSA